MGVRREAGRGLSQQTWIAVSLLVGFVVFITLRDELSDYLDIIGFGERTAAA